MKRTRRTIGWWMAGFAALLLAAPAAAEAPRSARQRARALASDLHASVAPRVLAAKLTAADHAALLELARDRDESLYVRARALGFAGVRRGPAVERLWTEARRWPERELRVQAAWAQGMARLRTPKAVSFAQNLLADSEEHLREVGAHLLFLVGSGSARALAKAHLSKEKHPRVRALIRRRLREHAGGLGVGRSR